MGLSIKHQQFISEYLKDFNGTQAAIRCGYKPNSARVRACIMLAKDNIKAEIQAQIAERTMSAEEVLTRIADIARGDMAELMDITTMGATVQLMANGKIKPQTKLIKKLKQKVTTSMGKALGDPDQEIIETELELYSAQDALVTLAKHHGLLVSRTEITGAHGGPVDFSTTSNEALINELTRVIAAITAPESESPSS